MTELHYCRTAKEINENKVSFDWKLGVLPLKRNTQFYIKLSEKLRLLSFQLGYMNSLTHTPFFTFYSTILESIWKLYITKNPEQNKLKIKRS